MPSLLPDFLAELVWRETQPALVLAAALDDCLGLGLDVCDGDVCGRCLRGGDGGVFARDGGVCALGGGVYGGVCGVPLAALALALDLV